MNITIFFKMKNKILLILFLFSFGGDVFLGSSTIFVASTDVFHAFRGVKQTMWFCGLITFQKGKKFKHTLLQALISMAVYTTAKGSTHYILQN